MFHTAGVYACLGRVRGELLLGGQHVLCAVEPTTAAGRRPVAIEDRLLPVGADSAGRSSSVLLSAQLDLELSLIHI